MAHIALQMTACAGIADEHCNGCNKAFDRGEQMNAIEYESGEKAGWYCQACVDYWKEHGQPPQTKGDPS
jgi:hypothetical protein